MILDVPSDVRRHFTERTPATVFGSPIASLRRIGVDRTTMRHVFPHLRPTPNTNTEKGKANSSSRSVLTRWRRQADDPTPTKAPANTEFGGGGETPKDYKDMSARERSALRGRFFLGYGVVPSDFEDRDNEPPAGVKYGDMSPAQQAELRRRYCV